jgi:hypothetical protein
MRSFRRHLRACTWLAVLAMLTLALGPTISRLTLPEEPSRPHAFAIEVPMDHAAVHHAALAMTAMHGHHHHPAGMVPTSPPTQPVNHHTLEHCALCAVAASVFTVAAPPPVVVAVATVRRNTAVPAARRPAPGRTLWSPTTSRGPPLLAVEAGFLTHRA